MASHGAAVRYARALFETTLAEGRDVAAAYGELQAFASLVSANAGLERVLTNDPGLGVARHADAGYDIAIRTADEHRIVIPMR